MRFDNIGFFWEDLAKVKEVKPPKPKRTPPEPVWLLPSYLPNLAEAEAAIYDEATYTEISAWAAYRKPVIFDIESYPNYTLIMMMEVESKKLIIFEDYFCVEMDRRKLLWCLKNLLLVGFNSRNYDVPIATLAAAGARSDYLHWATEQLIVYGERPYELLKKCTVGQIGKMDHIDLIELTALGPGLKSLAGRLHSKRMQELPFVPGTRLSEEQICITKWYCRNDLANTYDLFMNLQEEIKHRTKMSEKYGIDLRSKSDAQIAEAVISNAVKKRKGVKKLNRTFIDPGTAFRFKMPDFIQFRSQGLRQLRQDVVNAFFIVQPNGSMALPDELSDISKNRNGKETRKGKAVVIAGKSYRLGIGGLHSEEHDTKYESNDEYILKDRDVTSYYPRLILNAGMVPRSMGEDFTPVYNGIVVDRIAAKAAGDSVTADGLKITVNGSFGKLGDVWSMLYSPDLLIQTTVLGQLSLLMLIERLEWERFNVVSANTDGIVIYCRRDREAECDAIVAQWERDTGFQTEETRYKGLYSRDVNSYIAVYETPQKGKRVKLKGAFVGADRTHNPNKQICTDAVIAMILDGTDPEKTIRECRDITRFITVRKVTGGAVKDGEYLGKYCRWYYAENETGEIVYAKSGNRVPESDGGYPCMLLPDEFPGNVDYPRYVEETKRMLRRLQLLEEPENETV